MRHAVGAVPFGHCWNQLHDAEHVRENLEPSEQGCFWIEVCMPNFFAYFWHFPVMEFYSFIFATHLHDSRKIFFALFLRILHMVLFVINNYHAPFQSIVLHHH